jgi:hypothetical protein
MEAPPMIMAPVVKLARFQGRWGGTYSIECCYMCKGDLYHTEQEHELLLSQGLREEITR